MIMGTLTVELLGYRESSGRKKAVPQDGYCRRGEGIVGVHISCKFPSFQINELVKVPAPKAASDSIHKLQVSASIHA